MIRFNLGCGKKLLNPKDGWVNVDIVSPEDLDSVYFCDMLDDKVVPVEWDKPLFHQSDLKSMTFVSDNTADEVHGYHIIEHFYRAEVPEVLKEWKRVLKPGGVIVLEQPDVLKCAANLLLGITRSEPTLIHNMGVLGFFGDGTPDEPYMSHKWGWFPQTLGAELEKAGFEVLGTAPAETHAGDARDFRIVGRRPE